MSAVTTEPTQPQTNPSKSQFGQAPVSIVVLTMNEADNIGPCLESCSWCDDVHVLDSGSTDATCEIARKYGAQVHIHPFESFGKQRNWAIDNIPTKYEWQFHLDADERFTRPVVQELAQVLGPDGKKSDRAAYQCPSKLIFMGRWLRHSANYPTYQVRLFHKDRCRFIDYGHGQREDTTGVVDKLKQPYIHYNFSKGLFDWVAKHNKYSTREAEEGLRHNPGQVKFSSLFKGDAVEKRRALKGFAFNMPAKPLLRFVYSYILKGGWRDGKPGFHYCLLMSFYEYLTVRKMREMQGEKI